LGNPLPKRTLTPRHITGINSHISFGSKLTVEYSVHCITHHPSPPRDGDNFVTFYGYFSSYFFDYQTRHNIFFSFCHFFAGDVFCADVHCTVGMYLMCMVCVRASSFLLTVFCFMGGSIIGYGVLVYE
jgi:hypothetical protein